MPKNKSNLAKDQIPVAALIVPKNLKKLFRKTTHQGYSGPDWAWKVIWETIRMDIKSKAFDPKLREQIQKAFKAILKSEALKLIEPPEKSQ